MKNKLRLLNKTAKKKAIPVTMREAMDDKFQWPDGKPIDSKALLIQLMVPPAVQGFFEELEAEVSALCGKRGGHDEFDGQRWGSQAGSIMLANQRLAVERPRLRSKNSGREIVPETYTRFQNPTLFNEQIFVDGMKKVSQRDYSRGLPQVAASFGVTKSSVSRRWIKATEKKFEELMGRDISAMDITAIFIDGKTFQKQGVVIALGVSSLGSKFVLGVYCCSTENSAACNELIENLKNRGLPESGLLFIVDGGSGLNKSLNEKYLCHDPQKRRAIRVRCFKHKWNNIRDTLSEEFHNEASALFWSLRDCTTRADAESQARALKGALKRANVSALKSFEEAEDDLLSLFDLRMPPALRKFFSTTNAIESLNNLLEEDLRRVKRWQDSSHFVRWLSTSCLYSEKRFHKINGHVHMKNLKIQLTSLLASKENFDNAAVNA